jgi:hypothetical protein
MGVRLYSPALGRFLQVDPVPGGSLNAYEYATQDPINVFDTSGRVSEAACWLWYFGCTGKCYKWYDFCTSWRVPWNVCIYALMYCVGRCYTMYRACLRGWWTPPAQYAYWAGRRAGYRYWWRYYYYWYYYFC